MTRETLTEALKRDLATLAHGGDISEFRFSKLCDAGLAGWERKTTLRGTKCIVKERAWLTPAGRQALAEREGQE